MLMNYNSEQALECLMVESLLEMYKNSFVAVLKYFECFERVHTVYGVQWSHSYETLRLQQK